MLLTTITPTGNPQGKGLVTSLESLSRVPATQLSPKNLHTILKDYLVGTLVVSSEFKFVPVPGKQYYLYFYRGQWQLSLVSPEEWRGRRDQNYVCSAQLLADATWRIAVGEDITQYPDLLRALEAFSHRFTASLPPDKALHEGMSFYQSELSYYPRVYAYALSKSLNQSLAGCEGADKPMQLVFGGRATNLLSLMSE